MEVLPADTDWVVAFVNGYGSVPRLEAGEQLEPYPPPGALGEHDPALTSGLSEAQLVALADRLHRFFAACSREEAAVVLDGLLEESAPALRVRDAEEEGYEMWWSVWGTAEGPLTASCALALVKELDDSRRFGICEAERCVDVFVDRSPGGRRRYCSSLCHTRSKVSAYRQRQKQSGTAQTD